MGNYTISQQYQTSLTTQAYDLFEYLLTKAELIKGSLCTVVQKASLALDLDKDRKTVDKYLKELEKQGAIQSGTKRGRSGGTLVLLSADAVNFPTTTNIINSKEQLDELMGHFFPQGPKKDPKKKYRTKEEILRARLFQTERQKEISRLNDMIAECGYPTVEFFNETDNPLMNMRAYLLSRLYNSFVLIYPNERKDYYESIKDEKKLFRSQQQMIKYKSYDCLPTEFIGTPAFEHFIKLAHLLENSRIDPVDYLTSQFNYMNYLEMSGRHKVGLPFVNTLWGRESFDRHIHNFEFWNEHYKKHPYYKPMGDILKSAAWKYPIVSAIMDVYEDPAKYKELDPYQDVINTIQTMGYVSNKQKVFIVYCENLLHKIEKSDLSQEEKDVLTTYVKQQFALGLGMNRLSPSTYITTFPYEIMSNMVTQKAIGIEDYREYYTKVGNIGRIQEYNMNDKQLFTKRGYFYDFSLTANTSFPSTLLTLNSIRRISLDRELLAHALKEYGEDQIPITHDGMIDLTALYDTFLKEEHLKEDKDNYNLFHEDDLVIDSGTGLWYDVINTEQENQYKRNGRRVIL